jgi:hypothetical protein
MSQVIFAGTVTPQATDLDANFTDLYTRTQLLTSTANGIGVGTTPSNAYAAGKVVQITSGATLFGTTTTALIAQNINLDATGNPTYASNNIAHMYKQAGGLHQWSFAPSGTLGASISFVTLMTLDNTGNMTPGSDNTQRLGGASNRWSVVYAGTGSINTSDAREKTPVLPLTDIEIAAAKALASEIGTYQWLAAVQAKGADARTHVGVTVQRVIEVMSASGLDPMKYGFVCYDQWVEVKDADGNVTEAAGDRYSLRPDELLLFVARGFDARLKALEAGH